MNRIRRRMNEAAGNYVLQLVLVRNGEDVDNWTLPPTLSYDCFDGIGNDGDAMSVTDFVLAVTTDPEIMDVEAVDVEVLDSSDPLPEGIREKLSGWFMENRECFQKFLEVNRNKMRAGVKESRARKMLKDKNMKGLRRIVKEEVSRALREGAVPGYDVPREDNSFNSFSFILSIVKNGEDDRFGVSEALYDAGLFQDPESADDEEMLDVKNLEVEVVLYDAEVRAVKLNSIRIAGKGAEESRSIGEGICDYLRSNTDLLDGAVESEIGDNNDPDVYLNR